MSFGCSDGDTSSAGGGSPGTGSSADTTTSSAATTGAGGESPTSSTADSSSSGETVGSSTSSSGGTGGSGGTGTSSSGETVGSGTSSSGEAVGSGGTGSSGETVGSGTGGAGGSGSSSSGETVGSGAGGAGGSGSSSSGETVGSGAGGSGAGGAGGSETGSSGSTGGSGSSSSSSSSTGGGPVIITDPGTAGDGNYTIGPNYTPAPEGTVIPGVPVGAIYNFTLSSSVIFPGVTGPYVRKVAVYVPQQYTPGVAAPFIVVQDGIGYVDRLTPVLDNLIAQHSLPTMLAVFINSGPGNGPGSERGFEYDTLSNDYVDFVETEVLPKVQTDYNVKLTTDPEGRAAMGGSSGGAASFTMGWLRPDLYRRIITYSGSFVNLHPDAQSPNGAAEYWMNLIPASPPKPLRVFLEVGDMDLISNIYGSWRLGNMHMAAQLAAKGYHYRFLYATNAGHIDDAVIKSTLAETLLWVWRGYPVN
jgi:iron(III)-enterobactin esterase